MRTTLEKSVFFPLKDQHRVLNPKRELLFGFGVGEIRTHLCSLNLVLSTSFSLKLFLLRKAGEGTEVCVGRGPRGRRDPAADLCSQGRQVPLSEFVTEAPKECSESSRVLRFRIGALRPSVGHRELRHSLQGIH